MKKLSLVWLFIGLIAGSLFLAACGDVDKNSTKVSADGAATTAASSTATTAAGGAATTSAAKPSTGDAASGEKLLTSLGCAGCHAQGGKVAGVGPKLAGTTRDEDYIRNIIRKGKAPMPAYTTAQVSDAQLEDLVAYIKNLK